MHCSPIRWLAWDGITHFPSQTHAHDVEAHPGGAHDCRYVTVTPLSSGKADQMKRDRTGPAPVSDAEQPLTAGWHVVDIDGIRQAYEVAGRGPVCVVHSGGPAINSKYLRMPLLEQCFTMIYIDPVGTGRSDPLPGGEYFVPTYARLVSILLDELKLTRPIFIGHSHGGFVGLELARQHPGLLRALVAYATAPVYNQEWWDEATRQMSEFVSRWPGRPEAECAALTWTAYQVTRRAKVVDRASFVLLLQGILPAYFADYRRTVNRYGPVVLDVTFDANRNNGEWDARGTLGKIDVPTLIIGGTYDFVCPTRWAKEMRAEMPAARLVELTGSGHFCHLEQQDEFDDAVIEFVSSMSE
jgi:pimeloyl-ACP methyl ester carboxylesterase